MCVIISGITDFSIRHSLSGLFLSSEHLRVCMTDSPDWFDDSV